MTWNWCRALLLPCAAMFVAAAAIGFRPTPARATPALAQRLSRIPLTFLENQGQAGKEAGFYAVGRDTSIAFSKRGVTFRLEDGASGTGERQYVLRQEFVGAGSLEPVGAVPSSATTSLFRGDRREWRTGLRSFHTIKYPDVWPGIDAEYSGSQDRVKAEFVVRPGHDPQQIRLAYRGASSLKIDPAGRLAVETPLHILYDDRPFAYQVHDGRKVEIACRYRLLGGDEYAFSLGDYDRSRPLVIDPTVLVQCGFLGGAGTDLAGRAVVDVQGSIYLTGTAESSDFTFPVRVGPAVNFSGSQDAFVAKLNPAGTQLEYCGYIGGTGIDAGTGVAVDSTGSAYVTGLTDSRTEDAFPAFGGFDSTHNGLRDAFIAKVNPAGTALTFCSYLGGSQRDEATSIEVDSAGNAYFCGLTTSSQLQGFPVLSGPDLTFNDPASPDVSDGFVAKVDAAGGTLAYCGYVGGAAEDACLDLDVTPEGVCILAGFTHSAQDTFPELLGPDLTANGGRDGFFARLTAAGQIDLCSFFGGSADDAATAIAIGKTGDLYLGGETRSTQTSFPVRFGPDGSHGGGVDAFVAKLPGSGAGAIFCGFHGGSGNETLSGLAVDEDGTVAFTGTTSSSTAQGFPVIDGPDLVHNGGDDAYVARVASNGSRLTLSTYLGGALRDSGVDVAIDPAGNLVVLGQTESNEGIGFPVVAGPDFSHNGAVDVFVAKLVSSPAAPAITSVRAPTAANIEVTWSDRSRNDDGFQLFRRFEGGQLTFVGAFGPTVTRHLDVPVRDGARHSYQVRAINAAGFSALSNEVAVVVPLITPTNLTAQVTSSTEVRLRWQDNTANETGYAIERRTGGGSFVRIGTTAANVVEFVDPSVTQGTAYSYRVIATNALTSSAPSNVVSFSVNLPAAPTQVRADALGDSVRITWNDPNANETGYLVERRTPTTDFAVRANLRPNQTEMEELGAALESEFIYRVRAVNGVGTSGPSVTDSAFTIQHPLNVRTVQVDGIVTLKWTDASALETSYQIIRGRTIIAILGANATSIGLGRATNIVQSTHFVTAVRDADRSDAVQIIVEPLRAPIGFEVVSVSRTAVDLRFLDTNSAPHQIQVERRIGSEDFTAIATLSAGATTFRDTQITPGKLHSYRLRAIGPIGESEASNVATAGPLAPPTGVTASAVNSSRVDIRWEDPNEIEEAYEIHRRLSGQTLFSVVGTVGPNVRLFSDTSATANRIFEYRVHPKRLSASEPSSTSSVRVLAAPTKFDLRLVNGAVQAVWVNNTTLASGVQVEVRNSLGFFVVAASVSSSTSQATLSKIPADATITARVRAFATRSFSFPSNTDSIRTPAAPAAMTGTALDSDHVRLTWTDRSQIEDGQEVQQREILKSGLGPWKTIAIAAPNAEEITTDVAPERRYQFRVRARVGGDASEWCPDWPTVTPLAAPTKVRARTAGLLHALRWEDVSRYESGYVIEARAQGGEWREVGRAGANSETYNWKGPKRGNLRQFRIRAVGPTGFSSYTVAR